MTSPIRRNQHHIQTVSIVDLLIAETIGDVVTTRSDVEITLTLTTPTMSLMSASLDTSVCGLKNAPIYLISRNTDQSGERAAKHPG